MNKVYSFAATSNVVAAAAATLNNMFEIFEPGYLFKLKSIFVDLSISRSLGGAVTDRLETTDRTQNWWLGVGGGVVGTQFTNNFINFTVAGDVINNGNRFYIKHVGQFFWDSFVISERLQMDFNARNSDLINVWDYDYSVVVEIEIKDNKK